MANLRLFENGLSNGPSRTGEDFRKGISDLQSVRNLRRASQPAALQNYRRDSLTREPTQSYRRGSVAPPHQPRLGYAARDSVVRESPIRDYQNYRRDSLTSRPVDSIKPEVATGRRGSDADDINWIAKYQKSDHHTDRLVNTKLEYDRAMGRNMTVQPNEPVSSTFRSVQGTFDMSQLPPPNPYRYEGTSKLTGIYLQPTRNDSGQRKAEEVHRSIRQRPSPSYPPSTTTATNIGRFYSPSVTETYGSLPPNARFSAAQTGSVASRFDHRNAFHRQSSTAGTSLPSSPALGRRNSVESNLYKTIRASDFTSRLERTPHTISDTRGPSSVSSKYMTEPTQTQSYRPYFNRAPSLPPFVPSGSSSSFSSIGGGNRVAASDVSGRRSSLANFSDLSSSNYRRSLDFGTLQSSSNTFNSPYRSTLGSDIRRNISHEIPLRRSSLSRFSPLPSALPSPLYSFPSSSPERNFGTRATHGPFRRSRSVIDG